MENFCKLISLSKKENRKKFDLEHYFKIIKIRFSSKATIVSPFEVSNRMKFSDPSFKASTTCLPFPISEVT